MNNLQKIKQLAVDAIEDCDADMESFYRVLMSIDNLVSVEILTTETLEVLTLLTEDREAYGAIQHQIDRLLSSDCENEVVVKLLSTLRKAKDVIDER